MIIIEGNFVDDKREGYGLFKYDGGSYEGYYKDNKQHGEGKQIIGENILVGTFVNGNCIQGTLTYEEGDIYIGELNEDLDRHGKGVFHNSEDGSRLEGIWANDVFVKECL